MNFEQVIGPIIMFLCFIIGGVACLVDSFKMNEWYEKLAERFTGTVCILAGIYFISIFIKVIML